jgi:hypothetical protein
VERWGSGGGERNERRVSERDQGSQESDGAPLFGQCPGLLPTARFCLRLWRRLPRLSLVDVVSSTAWVAVAPEEDAERVGVAVLSVTTNGLVLAVLGS